MSAMRRTTAVLLGLALAGASGRAGAAEPVDGASLYRTYCSTCHGETGRGDGPAAVSLDPRPADFADPKFWETRDDAAVRKVVKEGGAAVGKSPLMAAWGKVLNEAQVEAVIARIKSFRPPG